VNGAVIVVGAVVVTMSLLATSVWVLGRLEARAERREADQYRRVDGRPGGGQLRERLLHVAARLAHHVRGLHLRIEATSPWAPDLTDAFARLRLALPAPERQPSRCARPDQHHGAMTNPNRAHQDPSLPRPHDPWPPVTSSQSRPRNRTNY
jgi:hypothetical protein